MTRLALLAFVLLPSFAGSRFHLALRRSEPAKDSRLTEAPTRVSLWFTARPTLAFSRIRLAGPAGDIALDTIVADTGNALHASIPRPIGPGSYTVHWQTASNDGHPIRGEFVFTVAGEVAAVAAPPVTDTVAPAPVATPTTAPAPATTPAPAASAGSRGARWMEYVALLTVLGVLGFRHGVLPPLAARGVPTSDAADRGRRLGASVLGLYALAVGMRLYYEAVALYGREAALNPATLGTILTSTVWGVGWLAGAVGALVVAVGFALTKRGFAMGTPLALTGALGMVLSPALSGHAAANGPFVVSMTLDMLHILAAGVWIGGLLLVLIAGVPAMRQLADGNRDAAVSALVNSFHPLALFCAPIVVIAGSGMSWIRLGGFSNIWGTAYGQALIWKIAMFVIVAAMGMYNSLRARRALGAPAATRHFRRTGSIELFFAAMVIAVTTVLVATPLPQDGP